MRTFRATYNDRQGRKRESAKWYVEFRDHNETIRLIPGFTSKSATEELGRNLERLVSYHDATGGQFDPKLGRFLESLPERMRTRLVEIGLISPERAAVTKPAIDHVSDFESHLTARNNTPRYVRLTGGRVRKLIERCGFRYYTDINPASVQAELRTLRDGPGGVAVQTTNYYLTAMKSFCAWMVRERRATESPVASLRPLNARVDRRHERRAFATDELRRLISTAASGPEVFGMSGSERAVVYRLAAEAGLRANEIRGLTRMSFSLDSESPTVTVAAAYSKRKRDDTIPLRAEMAQIILEIVLAKHPAAPAFSMPPSDRTARMLRQDLSCARREWIAEAIGDAERADREQSDFLSYRDSAGRVTDFHALRHTFITNLARGGVHPKTAQALARHSTITLTMDRYTHSLRDAEIAALDTLSLENSVARSRTLAYLAQVALKALEVGTFEERLRALEGTVGQGQSASRGRRR